MKILINLLIVFVFKTGFMQEDNAGKYLLPKPRLTEEMKTYIRLTKLKLSEIHDTVGIVTDNDEKVQFILSYLLRFKNKGAVFIANRSGYFQQIPNLQTERTKNLFCFVDKLESMEDIMQYIKTNPFFSKRGYIQFILVQAMENKEWLHRTLDYIWGNKIFNFVIVYQIRNTVEVIGYNQFNQSYYNFTNHKVGTNIYPDKLNNLYGAVLKVDVIIDENMNTQGMPEGDGNWINVIQNKLQAKMQLVPKKTFWEIQKSLKNDESNFSLTSHFAFSSQKYIVKSGYPSQMDYIVAIVPTAGPMPQYQYLFQVFDESLWFILIATLIVICCFNIFLTKVENDTKTATEAFLLVIQCFFNQPNPYAANGPFSSRILILFWMYFCLLLATGFSTTLRSSLMNIKFDDNINSMEELKESGLRILIEAYVRENVEMLYPSIANQFETVDDVSAAMLKYSKETAFIIQLSNAKNIIGKRDRFNRHYYHVIEEFLMSGHCVYNFVEDSPLVSKINDLMVQSREFGLVMFSSTPPSDRVLGASKHMSLKLVHLQTAFYLWGFGLVFGAIVFTFEMFYSYYKYATRLSK